MMERIVISPRKVSLIRNGIMRGVVSPERQDREETGEEILLHCPEKDFLAVARIRRVAHVSLWDIAKPTYAHTFDPVKIGMTKMEILHMSNKGVKRVRVLVFDTIEEYTDPAPFEQIAMIGEGA